MKNIDHVLNKLQTLIGAVQKPILNAKETAEYTGLSVSTIYKLTSKRLIPHYRRSAKNLYFKRCELDDWMTSNPIPTINDSIEEATNYVVENPLT